MTVDVFHIFIFPGAPQEGGACDFLNRDNNMQQARVHVRHYFVGAESRNSIQQLRLNQAQHNRSGCPQSYTAQTPKTTNHFKRATQETNGRENKHKCERLKRFKSATLNTTGRAKVTNENKNVQSQQPGYHWQLQDPASTATSG